MGWQFWKNENEVGTLPRQMARQLIWRFGINVETMEGMQHVSKPGEMKANLIRVFDPKLLVGDVPIRSYGDLDAQQSAIQFEGSWHPRSSKLDGVVDLRASASA